MEGTFYRLLLKKINLCFLSNMFPVSCFCFSLLSFGLGSYICGLTMQKILPMLQFCSVSFEDECTYLCLSITCG